ncbi:putative mitochondrial protein [Tanacetum coccineum]
MKFYYEGQNEGQKAGKAQVSLMCCLGQPTTLNLMQCNNDESNLMNANLNQLLEEPYRYPPNQKDTIEVMVKEFLDSGVIRPSNSPFSSLIVMEAFEKLQQAMIQSPMLALPKFDEEFLIETDALGFGIGAVLQQNKHPIAYLSKTLALKHQSLSTYEKELLAVRLTTPFQSKWLPKLLGFDNEIKYKKGVDNAATDALSRIERQGVLFNLLAGTSNELMDEVVATWSSDEGLQATIKGLKNNTLTSSKYVWHNNQLRRKDKWVVRQNLELRKKLIDHFHGSVVGGHSGVVAKIGKVAYQLQLPDYVKVHHVFHVSQLKPCYIEVATMRSFPLCDSEDLLAATPLKLLELKMVKHNNRLVVLRMRLGKSWKT